MARRLPKTALRPDVVRVIEPSDGQGGLSVQGKRFADGKTLAAHLRGQPLPLYRQGIVVVFSSKADSGEDVYPTLVQFCVEHNIDLFVSSPSSRADTGQWVTWVVESTESMYVE